MNKVIHAKVEGIENAYFSISASFEDKDKTSYDDKLNVITAFMHKDSETSMIEWEPKYGAITLIEKCDEDWEGDYGTAASKHWYFGWCKGYGNWAQLAVDELGLRKAFVDGQFQYIFNSLKGYSQ